MSYTLTTYKGVVKDKVIVLEGGNRLPEGTKVVIIPQSGAGKIAASVGDSQTLLGSNRFYP